MEENSNDDIQIESNWPVNFITDEQVQESGLTYLGDGTNDILECLSCHIKLGDWKEGDDPLEAHKFFSPSCRISKRMAGVRTDKNGNGDTIPYNLFMTKYTERVETFEDWPKSISIPYNKMASAGFFYRGISDRVNCFYCGGELNNWSNGDDPLEAHRYWFPACEYLYTPMEEQPSVDECDDSKCSLSSTESEKESSCQDEKETCPDTDISSKPNDPGCSETTDNYDSISID